MQNVTWSHIILWLFNSSPVLFSTFIIGSITCIGYLALRKASINTTTSKTKKTDPPPNIQSFTFKKDTATPTKQTSSKIETLSTFLRSSPKSKISLCAEYSSQAQYDSDFTAAGSDSLYKQRTSNICKILEQHKISNNQIHIERKYAMIAPDGLQLDEIEGPIEPGVRAQVMPNG